VPGAKNRGLKTSLLQKGVQARHAISSKRISTKIRVTYRYFMPMSVYVILFNARSDNEGMHSLRVGDRHQVLMFEVEDDAIRFSNFLEAQDFPPASVEAFDPEEIEEFCEGAGYEALRVPDGALLMPPETMVEKTVWDPDADPDADPYPAERGTVRDASSDEMDRIRAQLEKLL
jgi:Protein of unknown function (DUF3110)